MKKLLTLTVMALMAVSSMADDYTCPLVVNLNGNDIPAGDKTVSVDKQADNSYTLSLKNFSFMGMGVGTIVLNNVKSADCGIVTAISTQQTIQIANGDDPNVSSWMGPMLGNVPINMKGEIKGKSLNAIISIDMGASLGIINVKVGANTSDLGQIPNAGFEDFHKAKYVRADDQYTVESDEPNGWHSFNSGVATGSMASLTETALFSIDTHIADEARPGSTGKKSVKVTSSMVMGFQPANGTMTTGRLQAGSISAANAANCSFLDMSKTDVDGNGDPFYTVLPNRPDSIAVWVKFKQGTVSDADSKYATMSAIITDGTYYQDPQDKDYSNIVAKASNTTIESKDFAWQRIVVPFDYATYEKNNAEAKALLVTLSTNAKPGVGSSDAANPDQLFVDDIALVYNASLVSLKVKGQNVELANGTNEYTVEGVTGDVAASDIEVATDGQGAYVTKTLTQDGDNAVVRITIASNDLKTTNTYTVTVKGATVTGIDNVVTTATGKAVAIYGIDGKRVNDMTQKGLYIVRYADGKTVKVLKK